MSTHNFRRHLARALFAFPLAAGAVGVAQAQNQVVYSSIPKPLPGNVASEGPEAYGFRELGDGVQLVGVPGTAQQVTVILSSWACVTGSWYANNCATPTGATFRQPITLNVYPVVDTVAGPVPGLPLASVTEVFDIPYRPSASATQCSATPGKWYSGKDKTCYNGLAVPIHFNLSGLHLALPEKVIVTVAFNSTHYGLAPVGESATCFGTAAGCPYDSLNIATDGNGGSVGTTVDANSIFVNYASAGTACINTIVLNSLVLDPGCWGGFHPQIEIRANQNSTPRNKKPAAP